MNVDELSMEILGCSNWDSSDTIEMARKRGGQPKHWAEKARILAWYYEIRQRCDWSDYKLDCEFAWTEEGLNTRATDHRPRTFENIRKSARKPAGLDKRWRGMPELVAAVGRHPSFSGTQELYEAEIWDLFQETSPTIETVEERINRLLQAHQLTRVPVNNLSPDGENYWLSQYSPEILFSRCLRLSMLGMHGFSQIVLLWSLYQQTEAAHNWPIRAELESLVDNRLDRFFATYFPVLDQCFLYYSNAIAALHGTKLNLKSEGYKRSSLLSDGTWPVIPKELVGKLMADQLRLGIVFEETGK